MTDTPRDPSLTEQIAAFLAATRLEMIPDNVLDAARIYVLDWLGSSLAGTQSAQGQMLRRYAEQQPAADATVFGLDAGRSPAVAALHNGATSHVLEMDDLDRASVTHPGCVVIPAALALAEARGSSGKELLAAVALGYEVAIRVGQAVGKRHYYYWHNTSTCGTFGSAAATGWLLGLSAEQHAWAQGNAGTQSSGLWQFLPDGAMSKHLHAGHAASAGLLAAELAAQGFTGPRRILEGERGFFAATAPDARPALVVDGLDVGMRSYKLSGVSFKPYPSCRHTHPAVDAALAVRARLDDTSIPIESVEIDTYRAALDLCDNPTPISRSRAWRSTPTAPRSISATTPPPCTPTRPSSASTTASVAPSCRAA
jgi:2-methylcitrate dehydratase PrpD